MRNLNQIMMENVVANDETVTSDVEDISNCLGFVIYLAYTGADLAGTAKLQFSLDNVTWFDAPNSGTTAHHTVVAAGGSVAWHVPDVYYPYVRASFLESGEEDATINARIYAKGI